MKITNNNLQRDLKLALPQPGDARKHQIFHAVIEIIGKSGIDEVTFESVGKQAKMARSHVAYYFKTRRSMIFETLEFVAIVAQEYIQSSMNPGEDELNLVAQYVDAHFYWLKCEPYHHTCMAYLTYQASFDTEFREFHTKIREIGFKRIISILNFIPSVSLLSKSEQKKIAQQIQSSLTGVFQISTSTNILSRSAARYICLKTCFDALSPHLSDSEVKKVSLMLNG